MSIKEMLVPFSGVAPALRGDPYKMLSDAIKTKEQSVIFQDMRKNSFKSGYRSGDVAGYEYGFNTGHNVGMNDGFVKGIFKGFAEKDLIYFDDKNPGVYVSAQSMKDLSAMVVAENPKDDMVMDTLANYKTKDDAFIVYDDYTLLDRKQIQNRYSRDNKNPELDGKKIIISKKGNSVNASITKKNLNTVVNRMGSNYTFKPYTQPSKEIIKSAYNENMKALVPSGKQVSSSIVKDSRVEEIIIPNPTPKGTPVGTPKKKTLPKGTPKKKGRK